MTTTISGAPTSDRINSLDGLRGVAALAVCWYHVTKGGKSLPSGLLADASSLGYLGVAVFFVISGFVIPWSLRNETSGVVGYGRFLGKRMLRLHPPFLMACLMAICLNWISISIPGYQGSLPASYLPSAIASLGSDVFYLTGLLGKEWTLVVAWTLALEVQFYVLAGLVALAIRPGRRPATLRAFLIAACVVGLFTSDRAWVFAYLPLFVLGWSAAWMKLAPGDHSVWAITAVAALATVFQHDIATAAASVTTMLAIRYLPAVSHPGLAWLGSISYSLYLIHVPLGGRVVNLCLRWVPEGCGRWVLGLSATMVSLGGAWVFFKLIEEPCHRLSRRWFQRSQPVITRVRAVDILS